MCHDHLTRHRAWDVDERDDEEEEQLDADEEPLHADGEPIPPLRADDEPDEDLEVLTDGGDA